MTSPITGNATVKTVSDRGFAFVIVGDKDVFLHRSAFANPNDFGALREGDGLKVEVDYDAPKGPRATKATLTEDDFSAADALAATSSEELAKF